MRPDWLPCSSTAVHSKHVHTDGPDNYQYACPGYPGVSLKGIQTGDGGALPVRRDGRDHPAASPSSDVPRLFVLDRHTDITGLSGTGVVAEGVQFSDGRVALRWLTEHPSTVEWDSVDAIIAVHGHSGATELRWLDLIEVVDEVDREYAFEGDEHEQVWVDR